MTAYEYDVRRRSWVKQCSRCGTDYIGTDDEEISRNLFTQFFDYSSVSNRALDGLQSFCKQCANEKVRKRNGVVENTQALLKRLEAQGGKCAICETEITMARGRAGASNRACVDHDHETGRVRGILCPHCNSAIGFLKDDIELLRKALRYLRNGRMRLDGGVILASPSRTL
jgi:hypothetical protein